MDKREIEKYMKKINGEPKKHFSVKKVVNRLMIAVIFFLSLAILCKTNTKVNNFVMNNLYGKHFSFAEIKKVYNKYLGGIFPLEKVATNTEAVFYEKLTYASSSKYKDGVKLEVAKNYLVPSVKSGLIVFVGEKEGYGNVIIVQGEDGVDVWYGNMTSVAVKLYDYVEKGALLGEVKDNNLYLVYCENGKAVDYEKYLN